MLQFTGAGNDGGHAHTYPRLMALVRHDDAVREYAYDRDSKVGHLDKALDEARKHGWMVVSMKADWQAVFRNP